MGGDRSTASNRSTARPEVGEATTLGPLVSWLERDQDAIAQIIERAILDDLPALVHAETVAGGGATLRASIASHLPVIAAAIRDGTATRQISVPAAADRYTCQLVHEGVPLIDLLRAYEVGHAALWTAFATTLRTGATRLPASRRAEVLELASLRIFDYLQTATAWAVTTYTRETERLERRAASRRAEAVAAVLAGTFDGEAAEHALGGYPLTSGHIGYVAWAGNGVDADRLDRFVTNVPGRVGARQHVQVAAGDGSVHGWFTVHGDRGVTAVGAIDVPDGLGFAVGDVHRGADGFRMTHDEALEARRVAELLDLPGPTRYESVSVVALASRDVHLARAFVERELGALLASDDATGRLVTTLGVYLDELASPTRTARRLGVHPNTVVQRLERIEQLVGRRIEPGRLQLRVAIELAPLVRNLPSPFARSPQPEQTPGNGTSTPT